MFSYHEFRGQASYHKTGTIEVNQHYYTQVKPVWLIALKVLGLVAMVAVGYAIAIPSLREVLPLWQTIVLVAGVMLIYVGVAFFVRPEPNGDNMGIAGGLANDPFQYSDNVNRWLWNFHCTLGPGRFAAETLLDVCVYLGLAGGEEVINSTDPSTADDFGDAEPTSWSEPVNLHAMLGPVTQQPAPGDPQAALAPNRFARR